MKKLLLMATIPFFSSGKITPEIATPDNFSDLAFQQQTLNQYDYLADMAGCGIVLLKMFYPSEHNKYPPSGPSLWLCLFSVDVISNGYGPGQVLPEWIYLDKKTGLWKKKKYALSREKTQRSLKFLWHKKLE